MSQEQHEFCARCRADIEAKIDDLEERHAAEIKELRTEVTKHGVLLGSEGEKTGLFGAVGRVFQETKDLSGKFDSLKDAVLAVKQTIDARENQLKGATWIAYLLWAVFGSVITAGLFKLIIILQAAPAVH